MAQKRIKKAWLSTRKKFVAYPVFAAQLTLLLDTCSIIWTVATPDSLSSIAVQLLAAETSEIFISPISSAEIAGAVERGRIELDRHWKEWFRFFVDKNRWSVIDISLDIIEEAYSLPGDFHADPADRIIVATTRLLGGTLLTADRKILSYPHVDTAW